MAAPQSETQHSGTQGDIPVAISTAVSNALLFSGEEEPSPEQRPLVERRDPATQNRARFERNQRLAAQGLMIASGILVLLLLLAITAWMALFVYFFVKGFIIYANYADLPCDQPLSTWLLLILLLPLMQGAGTQQNGNHQRELLNFVLRIVLLILGIFWMSQSRTCEKTNPHLYNFVHAFLIFLGISWTTFGLLPLLIVPIVFFGMRNGWFDGINGADADTIKNMDTVPFDASLFSTEPSDNLPEPECCVCSEPFGPDKEIKRTPCQHYFHEECLGRWLKMAKSCPLCRKDLEEAVLGGGDGEAV
mmetsp:Transcript_66900/g.116415  ORF Transcript_66900/g.116415 Transcript_66900/m.116415 type:complete len:305 (-) Transcript_66900:87-1001(-)